MFLHTVEHNKRNRVVGFNFNRLGETVHWYFSKILHAIGELCDDVIRSPSLETPTKISSSHRWFPWFENCIGAIDRTHVRASVSKEMEQACRGRKLFSSQNVLSTVDFDLKFTYILAGW